MNELSDTNKPSRAVIRQLKAVGAKLPAAVLALKELKAFPFNVRINSRGAEVIEANEYHASVYIEHVIKRRFAYDTMLGPIELLDDGKWRHHEDSDCFVILGFLQHKYDPKISLADVRGGMNMLLTKKTTSVVRDWLVTLEWDGEERMDELFTTYMTPREGHSPAYLVDAARAVLTGMVARACDPGCKFDLMPVLQGAQGIYKSTALRILAGGEDFYAEVASVKDVNDLMRIGSRRWVLDISEMGAYSKLDQEHFKTWLSALYDTFVDKFDKQPTHRPKGYVVMGSTNSEQVLRDSENRRYLPVRLDSIDIKAIERDREQLLAEAYVLYRRKGITFDVRDAKVEQEKHRIKPDWLEDLEQALDRMLNPESPQLPRFEGQPVLTMHYLMEWQGLGGPKARMPITRQIAVELRARGWSDQDGRRFNIKDIAVIEGGVKLEMLVPAKGRLMPRQARFWVKI